MAKNIVFIHGSPRKKGNTRATAALAIESARQQGVQVTEIDVTKLDFKKPGCISCYKCQQSEEFECALKDGVAEAVATLPQYDVTVISTPIYCFSYTAQIKILIDRMFSLMKFSESGEVETPLAGKTLALFATGGGDIEGNLDLLELQLKTQAEMTGSEFRSCLFPNAPYDTDAFIQDREVQEKARAFGRLLAG